MNDATLAEESLAENLRLSDCGWITREEPGPQDAAVELSGAMQDSKLNLLMITFFKKIASFKQYPKVPRLDNCKTHFLYTFFYAIIVDLVIWDD